MQAVGGEKSSLALVIPWRWGVADCKERLWGTACYAVVVQGLSGADSARGWACGYGPLWFEVISTAGDELSPIRESRAVMDEMIKWLTNVLNVKSLELIIGGNFVTCPLMLGGNERVLLQCSSTRTMLYK